MSLRRPLPDRCSISAPESLPASSAQPGRCSSAALATRTLSLPQTHRVRARLLPISTFLRLPTMAGLDLHTTAFCPG